MLKLSKKLVSASITAAAIFGPIGVAAAAPSMAEVPTTATANIVQASCAYKARKATNVRSGPGTGYNVIGGLKKGKCVKVVGTDYGWSNELGGYTMWSRLSTGGWVRSDLLR